MSKLSRKQYSPAFKAKVALDASREVATVADLEARYPISTASSTRGSGN